MDRQIHQVPHAPKGRERIMQKTDACRVEDNFLSIMRSLCLPKEEFCILLGFSGGADSSALLSLLHRHQKLFGYTLFALHVNHLIRGDEAIRDEKFCKQICKDFDIGFFSVQKDVPAIAKNKKLGLEETARDIRYTAFAEIASELERQHNKKVLIATAHNADDNAETVLFNLARGSALSGLCGIKRRRENIIRPIITSTKDEIIAYCTLNGIEYIVDSTNNETLYTRNKLRHLVMPILREINPALSRSVARTGELLRQDEDFIKKITYSAYIELVSVNGIELDKINSLHRAVGSRVIYRFLSENGIKDVADVHIDAVLRLCSERVLHSRTELPSSKSAVIEKTHMRICDTSDFSKDEIRFDKDFTYGINLIEETSDILARFDSNDLENIGNFKNIYKNFIQSEITSDKIVGVLRFRTRKEGDTVNINGINRKLKKVLWETESDPYKRDRLPIIYDDNGILWVPGARSRTGSFPKHDEKHQVLFYARSTDSQERINKNEK